MKWEITSETFSQNNEFKYFFPWVNNMHDYFDMYNHVTHSMIRLHCKQMKSKKILKKMKKQCTKGIIIQMRLSDADQYDKRQENFDH